MPSRFYPDALQDLDYSRDFFNFGQVDYCGFAVIKQRGQQNRHRRIFGRIDSYLPFQFFPAVDYVICHKTIIMLLNFLANKKTNFKNKKQKPLSHFQQFHKLELISDSKYTLISNLSLNCLDLIQYSLIQLV